MERVEISKSTIVFTILFVAMLIIAYYSRYILLISMIGIGIGVLINPVLGYLRKKIRLPRALSALIVLIMVILVSMVVLGSLYYLVADQVSSLKERWPEIQSTAEGYVSNLFNRFPWIQEQIQGFNVASSVNSSAMSLLKGFRTGIVAISGGVFALIIGLYTAVNGGEYFEKTVEAFLPSKREKAKNVMIDSARVIRGWFKAQLIDMVIIGFMTGLGLWIVGVEYWAVFGLLTAILGIIPYVGIILVVIATCLITLSSDPSKLPWILLVFGVTQQVEGDVILPLVMKGRAQLPVVPLLIFMMFLGSFFGILGVFIAPPLMAVLRTLYIELYLPYLEKRSALGQAHKI